MNNFGGIVQKAFYLGMGLASLAGEKATSKLGELRDQATKLAEELVERGEMTTEEARKFVDDLVKQSQQSSDRIDSESPQAPRSIEILNDDESPINAASSDVQKLKDKVKELQEELRKMQNS